MSASDVQALDWNSGTTAASLKPTLESISWYSTFGRVPHFTDVPKSSHRMICRLGQTAALWIHVDPTLPAVDMTQLSDCSLLHSSHSQK